MTHTFTEGGQITTHRMRMFKQVLKSAFFGSLFFGICTFAFFMSTHPKHFYIAVWYYFKALSLEGVYSTLEVSRNFLAEGFNVYYSYNPILPIEYIKKITLPLVQVLWIQAQTHLYKAFIVWFLSFLAILTFFLYRGFSSKSKKHLSGLKVLPAFLIGLKLRLSRKASKIQIGRLPLVKGTENQHMLITGGTGSGKTNCLHHLLSQIRELKQKAIIVDTTGVFLQRYYQSGKDILLNPFNEKSKNWHPWAECKTPLDYAEIAEAFIPHSNSDHENYWRLASRTVFTSLLQKFEDRKKNSDITRWLHFEPLANLCELMKGTKAAAHMDINSEKTASSVRSVSSTFLECLECLKDTTDPFSIHEWMQQKSDSWLFLQCIPSQRAFLRPLMSAWISCSIKGLLNLDPDIRRRIWFIIDELPTLQRVKDLETLLTEGRKYGGCGVLSLQTPAQLESIYGRDSVKIITGNTGTKVIFSEQDPEIAERISKSFGECEIMETQEGITYGAHEARDGVSLSMQNKNRSVVSSSQIQQLPSNTAFIKLPGRYPIAKVQLDICKNLKILDYK